MLHSTLVEHRPLSGKKVTNVSSPAAAGDGRKKLTELGEKLVKKLQTDIPDWKHHYTIKEVPKC